ncbi:OB-fold nucleic acid binding domain-containing protein [Aminithiophilus ramosus]|uniref:OB-fold nucleic acid binding domain-containing protein n=2 Tax=Synergistales TaxID=649776 RepID=A0A9Q7A837_9BACT|nr:OB-fold nucleic acid binding domain-containing protein [Aminithiophilus ramosus]QTX32386.1 OB-fold nucleic acid binding domain-containing protein [Aminithiophilus ramosus]QVL36262.1 OB-fold nucleic acid binding domain-containing protein [Synergistota bacterium]
MNVLENAVAVAGRLHLVHGETIGENRMGRYFRFSVRQDTPWKDGSTRHDFLLARAYRPEVQNLLRELKEGTSIRVSGEIRSSVGSGEMYILADEVDILV